MLLAKFSRPLILITAFIYPDYIFYVCLDKKQNSALCVCQYSNTNTLSK